MARKIISIVVAVLFLINDICFGLGVMQGSTQKATKDGMYAAAQRLLAIGRGTGVINFDESNISRRFEGGRGLFDPEVGPDYIIYPSKYQTNPIQVDYENLPTGWKNNPILKETDLIKAFKMFRDTQAMIPADRLEIKEGWFPVKEGAGEIPIARIERTGKGKYVLIIHTKFVKMWNHIRKNDVWFELYMEEYDRRTVSAAWGIFYRLAKHEMAELSKLGDTFKSAGHISFDPKSLPQDDETLANKIGGNYALVNDAIWLWFVGSYCFNDKTRYDNDGFLKRIDWFFDSSEARALKLHLEFPNLIKDPNKRMIARAFAFTINHDFFNRPNIGPPKDLNSPAKQEFVEEYYKRYASYKAQKIYEDPMYATGADKEAKAAQAPINEIKKANTPVELFPSEMRTGWFAFWFNFRFNHQLRRLTKGRPDAVEKQFAIARELAKLIQTLDSFEGRYYYGMRDLRNSDGKPFSREGSAKFNQKRALQILRKSSSIEDALQMINIARLIAQDIQAQIEGDKLYKLPKIRHPYEKIDETLVKVDLLPLIDKALSAYMGGLEFKAIVKGIVFDYMDGADLVNLDKDEEDSLHRIYVPQIDIEPPTPAQDKPAASQSVKQATEEPAEQPTASADELSFDEQVGIINGFLKENNISKNSLALDNKPWPTPSLEISDETNLTDISSLAKAPILKTLMLAGTSVEDISPAAKLVNLEILSLSYSPIKDISAVANLKNLRELYLDWTQVTDLTPLKGMALRVLDLSRTKVTDLTSLKGMNLSKLYLEGVKNITDEQKQIYELFENHPHPENLEAIDSLGKLITYDNIQGKVPLIIGGYPAYTGDSGIKEPTLIDVISDYIVNIGLDKGPGAVELPSDVTENIYKTIKLLHESQIEIFVPQSFKLTEDMKKALKDIGKREGRDPVQFHEYNSDNHLLMLLRQAPPPGVKRIMLSEDVGRDNMRALANSHQEIFKFIRLLSVSLPQNYEGMESGVKRVHQAKMMTMAILARLFENGKTPMVETLLRGILREHLEVNDEALAKFMNELGASDEEIKKLSPAEVAAHIIHLLGIPIKLVEKIGREIHLMKVFWEAA